jgi:hypothetical protein
MRIQRAIQEGHLKIDNQMKLDGHPFPQNMISVDAKSAPRAKHTASRTSWLHT